MFILSIFSRPLSFSVFIVSVSLFGACSSAPKNGIQKDPCREVLGALDIGSGATKAKVAVIDHCAKRIETALIDTGVRVGYSADLSANGGSLSSAIQNQGLTALRALKQTSETQPEVLSALRSAGQPALIWSGFATSAFRQASNGKQVVANYAKLLGVPLEVISHEREAELGFSSGTLGAPETSLPLVVWDIGAGSQQIVFRNGQGQLEQTLLEGKASNGFKEHLIRTVMRKDPKKVASPNPIGAARIWDARAALKTFIPAPIQVPPFARVIGIGGVFQISVPNVTGNSREVNIKELDRAIKKSVELDDAGLRDAYASTSVSNLFLVRGMMKKMKVSQVLISPYQIADAYLLEMSTRAHSSFRMRDDVQFAAH